MSSAPMPAGWWASLKQRHGVARGDLAGGITAALVLPAIEGSYGLVAFAPLGPDLVPLGFLLGALTAAVGTLATVLAGGRGPLLSGCSAALALLFASLVGWLVADRRFFGADGRPLLPLLLSFLGLGLVLAGVLQLIAARLRLGGLVRYIPYPVYAGYMNGVGVLMCVAMLPHLAGMPPGVPFDRQQLKWLAPVVAAVALWFSLKPRAGTGRLPAYLTGLLAATLLHHALALTPLAGALGPLFEPPAFAWPRADTLAPALQHAGLLADKIGVVLLFAAAAALMSTLQSALAAGAVDELTHARRDGDRELQAQGLSNVVLGAIGALPSAGATARSKVNLDAGARTGASRWVFAVALLLVLAFGLRFMHLLPMAAIAGVFVALAFSMVDAWSRGATRIVLRQAWRHGAGAAGRVPLALLQSYAVMLLVAGVTVFVSLALAVFLGVLVAMLLFIRSNCRPPVRQVAHADRRRSRKIRPAAHAALLAQHGARIALVELDGALFFGTAQQADAAIEALAQGTDTIVLDFERVTEVDASGAHVLLRAADAVGRAGKQLLLSGLAPHDARARSIQDMDVQARLAQARIFPDADRALEFAEDRLVAALAPAAAPHAPLPLADTLAGGGLDAGELAVLAGLLVERRFAQGELIFRRGDPGDALYVLLQGQVGIWLQAPGDGGAPGVRGRRLVSYAPGVVFGEMGLMQRQPRSADALAEQPAVALELVRSAYEALARAHPTLLGKLLLNINGLLSARVRALTDELDAAQSAP